MIIHPTFLAFQSCLQAGATAYRWIASNSRGLALSSNNSSDRDLRFNKIKRIPSGSFPHLPHLTSLLLNNNEIEELEERTFEGLPQLRYLYLYRNRIRKIHPNTFAYVPLLEQLFLQINQLTTLPPQIFAKNPHLRRLRLDSNALVCDCGIMWLHDMLEEKRGSTQAAVTCTQPANLRGRSLMTIPKEYFQCESGSTQAPTPSSSRQEKPTITLQPHSVNVAFGNAAYFTCRAEGDPVPEIMWMHNESMINANSDGRYRILNDGTLMIEQARDSDQGVYECIARNAAGSVHSGKVELRYFQRDATPQFVDAPQDVTATEGDNAELQCRATGRPSPTISWTHNSAPIAQNIRARQGDSGSLTIINVRVSDAGLYECRASSSDQTITSSARLRVLVRPVITTPPRDVSIIPGTSANFTCEARGDSQPVLSWTKDGGPLRNNGRYEILRDGEVLRINSVVGADEGVFTCRAENAAGFITSDARLRTIVNEIPTFSQRSELMTALAGSDIRLQCEATGRPDPLYDWMREGRVIQNRNRFLVRAGELQISNVQQHDAGRYDCLAENVVGRATKSIFLQIHGVSRAHPGDRFVSNAIPEATSQVNFAINETLERLFDTSRTHSVQDLLSALRYPDLETLNIARAEEIFEQTLEIIHRHVNDGHRYDLNGSGPSSESYTELVSPSHLRIIANMSGCLSRTHQADCADNCFHRRFRAMDGICNNLQNPTWGAANTAFRRLLPAIYENGFNQPVGWNRHKLYRGVHVPSARLVSSLLLSTDRITNDDLHTHMVMQWGQFIDHDMDLAPQAVSFARFSDGQDCNETCENTSPCFPITVPSSDPRIRSPPAQPCLGFTRTSATCNTGTTSVFFNTVAPRQQLNALTAFIDASNVYGNSDRFSGFIRHLAGDRGLLREGPYVNNRAMLPFDDGLLHHLDCQIEHGRQHVPCFITGDPRANEQIALTAVHTLWMREHNRIATVIHRINSHWNGNKIFHETRKIVGAQFQHITYKHWLPKVIGPTGMARIGPYEGYKPDVDPSIANEFAVAALRFGHTLVQPVIFRLNESFQEAEHGHLPLHRAFFSPYRLMEEGGIDPLLRGLFARAAKKRMPGEFFNSELTERLFTMANAIGQDLASLNVQRGRDHAIQFYNDYRVHCGLSRANSFDDLREEIQHRDTRQKLQALYGHPDNIDLFIGGLSETLVEGAKVGPTFLCILADQFKRLRDGDRFWYERDGLFTNDQLVSIKQSSLSSTICDNSGVTRVQKDVFLRVDNDEEYLSCDQIPRLDLRQWSDCCETCRTSPSLAFGNRGRFRRRRSTEYSYPDQRPHQAEVPITPVADDPAVYEKVDNHTCSNHVDVEEEAELSNKAIQQSELNKEDLELMETRIEGLEEYIFEMGKIIQTLKKKIHHLERQSPRKKASCRDNDNRSRRHGEKWDPDNCTQCTCQRGHITCRSENCDVQPAT
ncbi:hypothetical protein RRG08_032253 [Elysia crispata]|uniref:Cell adhesion molecule-related/down-regulated by oncogenes n=1 Tax=Elysia crispata TaxID=231223 RepID=A0AAE1E7D4_9GAST|nr:hypothetical protein RRG08_032253 [Elysia crispata]